MYSKFFGLNENPFCLTPDTNFLHFTASHREALAQLFYGIWYRKGFIVLSAEVGMGKTLLLNRLLEMLTDNGILSAYIFNPVMTTMEMFEYIAADFGLPCSIESKSKFLVQLNDLLIELYSQGKPTVLIVDEAQNLTYEILEELRMLTNLETRKEKLLQIILCGQPELIFKLDRTQMRQLKQRIALRCTLKPLTLEETESYILARLRIAGLKGKPPFNDEVIKRIYRFSGGIPRVINNICDNAMLTAFTYERTTIDLSIINEVSENLKLTTPTSALTAHSALLSKTSEEEAVPVIVPVKAGQPHTIPRWSSLISPLSRLKRRIIRSVQHITHTELVDNLK
ncbi:MAG: AAA family ATPase [Acidobacteriota bacterium]